MTPRLCAFTPGDHNMALELVCRRLMDRIHNGLLHSGAASSPEG